MKAHSLTRKGFTLLEILLVMAILIIISAVCLPTINSMYGDTRVHGAADEIRRAWAEARSRAIENGTPYRFSVKFEKIQYRIAPDTDDFWSSAPPEGSTDSPKALSGSLPDGISFTRDTKSHFSASGDWSTVAVFLPDGTCRADASVAVQDGNGSPLTVSVRGLTGTVMVKNAKQEGR
jgi:prepilin-type N-terminal cleavage/methylation domain-containing protein